MPDQLVNGKLTVEVPGAATPIEAVSVNVQSFGTSDNAANSHYIRVRDIGAQPPDGKTHFAGIE